LRCNCAVQTTTYSYYPIILTQSGYQIYAALKIIAMSKDRKTIKEKKKEPTVNLNKKVSSYQSDKSSVSKADNAIGKKSK